MEVQGDPGPKRWSRAIQHFHCYELYSMPHDSKTTTNTFNFKTQHLTSLIIMEMQTMPTMTYHYVPTRIAKTQNISTDKGTDQLGHSYTAAGSLGWGNDYEKQVERN